MDIYCRICSEPYSNVGGLHYSHSDMTWWHYDQFLRGLGCPCCTGDARSRNAPELTQEEKDERTRKWASSILGASDTYPAWPGFEEATGKPWTEGLWVDEPAPLWERLTGQERVLLQELGGGVSCPDLEYTETSRSDEFEVTYELPSEYFSGDGAHGLVQYVNQVTLLKSIEGLGAVVNHGRYRTDVRVAVDHADGTFEVYKRVVEDILDALASLQDYPCLDDTLLSKLESDATEEEWDRAISVFAGEAAAFLGCDEKLATKLLTDNREKLGKCERDRDDDFNATIDDDKAFAVLAKYACAPGWEFYHGILADVWIGTANPAREEIGDEITGVLINDNSAEFVESMRFSEFRGDGVPTPRSIGEIPLQARIAFLKLLKAD